VPNLVFPGTIVTFTLSVTNNGPPDCSGALITDTLPAELSFSSSSDCSASGQVVSCQVPALPAGGSVTLSFDALVAAAVSFTNTAVVIGNENDSVAGNNSSTTAIAVQQSAIPTLDPSGLALLALVIGAVAFMILRRQGV
jgi:uncharacterized repeat protein (TIGR01451 family)